MADIYLPVMKRTPVGWGMTDLMPRVLRNQQVVLHQKAEADMLSQLFDGRKAKPRQEVVLVAPDGITPIMVCGLGVTEVAELEDVVHRTFEESEQRIRQSGSDVDHEEMRDRAGMPTGKDRDTARREWFWAIATEAKRNIRSIPDKKKRRPDYRGGSQVSLAANPVKE